MTKIYAKNKAIELRKAGFSYGYISNKLNVSKGTLSVWLESVSYTPNQETVRTIGAARAASGAVKTKIKQESITEAKYKALQEAGKISKRDLFMLGLGIYIGEGTKSVDVRVVNSNPLIIRFAIKWFKEAFGLQNMNFRIRLHLYPDNNEQKAIEFWSEATGLSEVQFQKTQYDLRKNKKTRNKGKLPFGTAHLTVRSNGKKEFGVFLSREINALIDLVLS